MNDIKITDTIKYIGVNDKDITLFEGQYMLEKGMAYNSYFIDDDKLVVLDTVDKIAVERWMNNLEEVLNGRKIDYLVIHHLEPDHSAGIEELAKKYPDMKIIGNEKIFSFLPQFCKIDNIEERKVVVSEGEEISFGKHTLKFFMAPMVHWPEVMVSLDLSEKVLFSADAFGKFGTIDADEEWDCEARRYYFNIVGKYGIQVQALLKKLEGVNLNAICALHGPILKDNLEYYINKYDIWSKYEPEDDGVFIACASIHGNTYNACEKLKEKLESKGVKKVVLSDLTIEDEAEAIEDAFRYNKVIFAASSYNFGLFPPMQKILHDLQGKNYQKRVVGLIENGTWAPSAGKCMKEIIEQMKDIDLVEPIVTIKTKLNDDSEKALDELVDNIISK